MSEGKNLGGYPSQSWGKADYDIPVGRLTQLIVASICTCSLTAPSLVFLSVMKLFKRPHPIAVVGSLLGIIMCLPYAWVYEATQNEILHEAARAYLVISAVLNLILVMALGAASNTSPSTDNEESEVIRQSREE